MDRKPLLESLDTHAAYMADLRSRDAEFRHRMLKAIKRGEEHCPISVDTTPRTRHPVLGYMISGADGPPYDHAS